MKHCDLQFFNHVFFNDIIKNTLFSCENLFEHSDYREDMVNFSDYDKNMNNQDDLLWFKKREFIALNAQWLYVDFNGNLYGILNDFIIKVDDKGSFFYLCHGIQNLPDVLYQKNSESWRQRRETYAKKSKTTYKDVYQQYLMICQKYHLMVNMIKNSEEFEQFLTNHI